MGTNQYILEAQGITKFFPGVKALSNASLQLIPGEVHALIGENGSGKTTLMKVIIGLYQPDEGAIYLKGEKVHFKNPKEASNCGISMIHQEISLVPSMTVAENIWLGRESRFSVCGILNVKKRESATGELLKRLKLNIDPHAIVSTLSVASMQLVELARAVSYDSDIIIMDEPTSALTESEIETLFEIVHNLATEGKTIVFISHKIEEIFTICDRVTILRDGQNVATKECSDLSSDELIHLIAGREIKELFPKLPAQIGDVALEIKNLSSEKFHDISFQVHHGEIFGFFGLMGAGRTEIMRSIFGIDRYSSGEILINGEPVKPHQPYDAIKAGLGMVTEDRLRMGILSSLSVKTNITISNLDNYVGKVKLLRTQKESKDCADMMQNLSIKAASQDQAIGSLSGGNQQKAIIGRWLLCNPQVFILDEPTRGIDVGSKSEIHRQISQLAQQGMAIIIVSSELPEVMGMSDRIAVVRDGSIVYECTAQNADKKTIIKHAFGVAKQAE